jgi:hypothetical protein
MLQCTSCATTKPTSGQTSGQTSVPSTPAAQSKKHAKKQHKPASKQGKEQSLTVSRLRDERDKLAAERDKLIAENAELRKLAQDSVLESDDLFNLGSDSSETSDQVKCRLLRIKLSQERQEKAGLTGELEALKLKLSQIEKEKGEAEQFEAKLDALKKANAEAEAVLEDLKMQIHELEATQATEEETLASIRRAVGEKRTLEGELRVQDRLRAQLRQSQAAVQHLRDVELEKLCLDNEIAELRENITWEVEAGSEEDVALDYRSLKRKAEDILYTQTAVKKMKDAKSISNGLQLLPPAMKGRLRPVIQSEILRYSGKAGLISPLHFSVVEGFAVLTNDGIERVHAEEVHGSYDEALRAWTIQKDEEASNKVRACLDAGSFWEQGHPSLSPLIAKLRGGNIESSANIIDMLEEISIETKGPLEKLHAFCKDHPHDGVLVALEGETLATASMLLGDLHGMYGSREIALAKRLLLADRTEGGANRLVGALMTKIRGWYSRLLNCREGIRDASKIPQALDNSLTTSMY